MSDMCHQGKSFDFSVILVGFYVFLLYSFNSERISYGIIGDETLTAKH